MEGTIGEIRVFAGNFAPRTWSFCQGQLMPISQNTALFAVVGTYYGGDGRTTFGLPDLRGRTLLQQGRGPGLPSFVIGQIGGVEKIELSQFEMPTHNHATSTAIAGTGTVTGEVKIPVSTSGAGEDSAKDNFVAANVEIYSGSGTDNAFLGDLEEDLFVGINNLNVSVNVDATGGTQAYDNMMPCLAMNYIILFRRSFSIKKLKDIIYGRYYRRN